MAKLPKHFKKEVLTFLLLFLYGIFLAVSQPLSHLSDGVIRHINGVGLWFQLAGVILLAFEFLRSPLVDEQNADFEKIRNEQAKYFYNRILKIKDNKEKIQEIYKHEFSVLNLNKVYYPAKTFKVTVRRVYWMGLIFICFGYTLQLSVI